MTSHTAEQSVRFAFGRNWRSFAEHITEERVAASVDALRKALHADSLAGQRFLDIGCGSGLSSLAARRLGMKVRAFDYDPESVVCSKEVRRKFSPSDADWIIEEGDVLDVHYMQSLGQYDVVYSWGVLHHTGQMWGAIENAMGCVVSGGSFVIAIYNDQGGASRRWSAIKRIYQRLPGHFRPALVAACIPVQWWKDFVVGTLRGRPLAAWHAYSRERGMSPWHDMVDWVGGYPFEVAKPEEIFEFFRTRGFTLQKLRTCGGGIGCNEFVFRRL